MGVPYITADGLWEAFSTYNTMVNNRLLAHAIGKDEALLWQTLLSKRTYYEEHNMLDDDGYFYATIDDLQESTTLSKYQQSQCCKKLEEIGLLEIQFKGLPKKRYFRLIKDNELLTNLLNKGLEISMSFRKKRAEKSLESQKSRNLTSRSQET